MLTTSATAGFAMKVTDHARAQGAILGKGMTGLPSSKGAKKTMAALALAARALAPHRDCQGESAIQPIPLHPKPHPRRQRMTKLSSHLHWPVIQKR